MDHMNMNDVEVYIRATKGVMDIAKTMIGMLPKGQHHEEAAARLQEAEKALRAAEVQLAHSLGYHLCQCTFPPQIMLSQGRHSKRGTEVFKCGRCEKQTPSQHHFDELDKTDRQIAESVNSSGWGVV